MENIVIPLDDIHVLEKILPSLVNQKAEIERNINNINRLMRYDYKYGSSWLDKWCLQRNIKKLNTLLKPFYIVVSY